jgi:Zn-dependent M28 family amino/carboxypeptidase
VERGSPTPNFEVEVRGSSLPSEIIVVGAHYDAFQGTPGADDNASGVAAALALARAGAGKARARTVRFVFFVNEEPPTFQTAQMGSWVYAKACRARGDNIVAMLSLETIGYYSTAGRSQQYPRPMGLLYPSTGDFVAFVGNVSSRSLVRRCVGLFRERAQFPSEGAALPEGIPGVGWSDHWAFWQEGYPAIMVTDTAPFRNPGYHNAADRPETLDYDRMSRVVEGLERVIEELADGK